MSSLTAVTVARLIKCAVYVCTTMATMGLYKASAALKGRLQGQRDLCMLIAEERAMRAQTRAVIAAQQNSAASLAEWCRSGTDEGTSHAMHQVLSRNSAECTG
eukprot:TRINITY_DN11591_c0_g1_i12.p2 TRINITY_DN11591_c0_g1~~TRINITY_DN11591_c0_g1_i12.p2  ORF type:complete len:103 (+),score=7.99 TRINITY_DN11591_c0_g1_i12:127-435(+)